MGKLHPKSTIRIVSYRKEESMKKSGPLFMIVTLFLALVGSLASTPIPALAATPTDVYLTEYIEGTSNNKAQRKMIFFI